jgi:hypothetical protein
MACSRLRNVSLKRNIDNALVKKILQFKLPAPHSFRIPAGEAQGLTPHLGRTAIFGYKKNDRLQDIARASWT